MDRTRPRRQGLPLPRLTGSTALPRHFKYTGALLALPAGGGIAPGSGRILAPRIEARAPAKAAAEDAIQSFTQLTLGCADGKG